MADLQATPRNEVLGLLSDAMAGGRTLANKASRFGLLGLLGVGAGDMLLGKTPEEINEWSYGNSPFRMPEMSNIPQLQQGRGQQVADMLGTAAMVAPMVKPAAKAIGTEALRTVNNAMMGGDGLLGKALAPSRPMFAYEFSKGYPKEPFQTGGALPDSNPNVKIALPSKDPTWGYLRDDMYTKFQTLPDGTFAVEHVPNWGSKEKIFHGVGDNFDELVSATIKRKNMSAAQIKAAEKKAYDNSLLGALENEYGKVFKAKKSERSASEYFTHEPSGTKIRVSDHDLPLGYEQPDIDLRQGMEIKDMIKAVKAYFGQ